MCERFDYSTAQHGVAFDMPFGRATSVYKQGISVLETTLLFANFTKILFEKIQPTSATRIQDFVRYSKNKNHAPKDYQKICGNGQIPPQVLVPYLQDGAHPPASHPTPQRVAYRACPTVHPRQPVRRQPGGQGPFRAGCRGRTRSQVARWACRVRWQIYSLCPMA